ncbi:IPP transferase-domain-containing protein [Aspergillus pseudoustus]|uniref:tRNA dimethylallyltransferase n=1 Tax=Aspergillus pseudoustus TaxID=1810923 RepID=A0ABR4KUR2_9EURO
MRTLVAVVGATGTGKSKLAVDLASRFNGEIINGDAMQMYRGLPIITNQIPVEERNGIPHHLISCIDLEKEPWRINMFRNECLSLIDDIHARGKLPVLVGGTHYYTQSVLFQDQLVEKESVSSDDESELCPVEDVDSAVKWPILDAEPEVVMKKLREVDPAMADRWHPKDTRKIRRSLEIFFQTGKPASQVYAEQRQLKQVSRENHGFAPGPGQLRCNTVIFWVHSKKPTLNERLNQRVDVMVEQGLMSEARSMLDYIRKKKAQGVTVDQSRGVWVSIGFKELAPYFEAVDNGSLDNQSLEAVRQECIERVKTATRQYGGSQVKWIRNKLWTALADAGMANRLYLLDSTDVEKWTEKITEPSERLVQGLLRDEPLPDPKSLSELARTTLEAKEAEPAPVDQSTAKCITCNVCHRTLTNEREWKIHIHGGAHKRAVKSQAKRAARDAYLRQRGEGQEESGHANAHDSQNKPDQ